MLAPALGNIGTQSVLANGVEVVRAKDSANFEEDSHRWEFGLSANPDD